MTESFLRRHVFLQVLAGIEPMRFVGVVVAMCPEIKRHTFARSVLFFGAL